MVQRRVGFALGCQRGLVMRHAAFGQGRTASSMRASATSISNGRLSIQ
jgi:hypothetical protein